MSLITGKKARPIRQPTSFQTLPGFARGGFEQAVEAGQAVPTGAFAPAGITGQQQAALGTLEAGLGFTTPQAFQAGLSTFGDPFEEQVIQNVIRDIQETGAGQLSDIGSFASAAGGFGGARQALLESELQRNIQRNVGDVSGRLRSQGFESAAQRTLADLSRTQDVAGNLFQLGDVQRQIQTQQQQAPIQQAQFLANLIGQVPGGGGQTTFAPARPGVLGEIGKLAGGIGGFVSGLGSLGGGAGGAGAGAAAAAFSDANLKENIKYIGKEKGHNIYEFNYKGIPNRRFIGVMAQEVQNIYSKAVSKINGYLAVNYKMLGLEMREVING